MYSIAIVGATGLVGRELLSILQERSFPISSLTLFASNKSKNESIEYCGKPHLVTSLETYSNEKFDIAFFSAGGNVSAEYAPRFAKNGAIVIDNTNTFRMDKDVPLIVPEVNPEDVSLFKNKNIISNPNCSTIELVLTLKPLDNFSKIKRVVVSTYQSVSGAGKDAIEELSKQVYSILNFENIEIKEFSHQIAFNCIPQIDLPDQDNYTKEEMKMIRETSKIMGREIQLTATCVRVPVFLSHSESVNIEFENELSPEKAQELLQNAPGIKVIDDLANNGYPLCINAAGKDDTFVGRIRKDPSAKHAINLWVVSDNIRKGAALNAIQIAELLLSKNLLTHNSSR